MKLLDWFAGAGGHGRGKPDASGLSRRDFFARVAGRRPAGAPVAARGRPRRQPSAERNVLQVFYVEGFPDVEGRRLLPELRAGLDLELRRDPEQRETVAIFHGDDLIGNVDPGISPIVARMMDDNDPPICRIRSIEPDAEPSRVLQIELLLFEL